MSWPGPGYAKTEVSKRVGFSALCSKRTKRFGVGEC
jgi:hypothetical protein